MAAFNRPTEATYEVHEKVTVDTSDNEDHTFCGIMFPVKCKDLLPLDHLVIKSVAVRGMLGPLTVWVNTDNAFQRQNESLQRRVRLNPKYWTKVYDKTLKPSPRQYQKLDLTESIKLRPGEIKVIYVHSTLHDDTAIVYDNTLYGRNSNQFEDDKLAIMTGRAHVSTEVFGQNPIWGYGNAWRDRREFVGRLEYGTVFKLWNPQVQPKFGGKFQDGARALFMCQRRWESPWSKLPDECIFYILNMCRWDWFHDTSATMKERRKEEKNREREAKVAAASSASQDQPMVVTAETAPAAAESVQSDDGKPAACASCCHRRAHSDNDDENDDDDDDDDDSMGDAEEYVEDDGNGDVDDDDSSDDDEDLESDADSDAWSEEEVLDPYHRANINAFEFRDLDSDEETDDESEAQAAERLNNWRSHFARIHVLRALASMEDSAVAQDYF